MWCQFMHRQEKSFWSLEQFDVWPACAALVVNSALIKCLLTGIEPNQQSMNDPKRSSVLYGLKIVFRAKSQTNALKE